MSVFATLYRCARELKNSARLLPALILAVAGFAGISTPVQAESVRYTVPLYLKTNASNTFWIVGDWSACSAGCGTGTQTRTATCSSLGASAPDSVCEALTPKPALTQPCTASTSCTFSWQTSAFDACTNTCGTGTQSRDVTCTRADGVATDDASCVLAKPSSTQSCSDYSNCAYVWSTGTWGSCSTTCGTGTQTRTTTCNREDGTAVSNALCTTTAPAPSQSCTAFTTCTYAWTYSAWSVCSVGCGTGTQTRTASCVRADGTVVADTNCSAATKLPLTQACSAYTSCTYSWTLGSWGACSNTCGTGTQTQTSTCTRSDGTAAASTSCTGTPTTNTQSCTGTTGCSYTWVYSSWSVCGATCGTGTQTRTATCQRSDGTTVADANCSAVTKQALSQACTAYTSCTYSWLASAWGTCSTTCGTGTQTRTDTCQRADGTTVANSFCTSVAPATSQSCSVYTGCSYTWVYSAWSACSAVCGTGTQTRTATCQRSDGVTVADTSCAAVTKQALSQVCSSYTGCTYSWVTGAWSACSTSCGTGTQTRTVSCTRSDGTIVANTSCTTTSPAASQACTVNTGCSIDLGLAMTAGSTTFLSGTPVTMTITITNTATPAATGSVAISATSATVGGFTCGSVTAGAACAANGAVTVPYGGSVVLTAPVTAAVGSTSVSVTATVTNTTAGYGETNTGNNSRTLSQTARDAQYAKWCYFPAGGKSVPSSSGSVYTWITTYVFDAATTCNVRAYNKSSNSFISNACFKLKGTATGVIPRFGVVYWAGTGSAGFGSCLNNGATLNASTCGYYGFTIMDIAGWAANSTYYGGGAVTNNAVIHNPGWPANVTAYTVWEENGPYSTCKAPGSAVWQNTLSGPY